MKSLEGKLANRALLLVLGLVLISNLVVAHPTVTFGVKLTDITGNYALPNVTAGELTRVSFTFQDMLANFSTIYFENFELYHNRYVHVLIMSFDWMITAHLHPDDFKVLTVNNTNSLFFVDINFPIAGMYSFSFEFMYNDKVRLQLREGVAQCDLEVFGSWEQNPNATTFNYTTQNSFITYPVNDSDIFDSWVNVSTNLDTSLEGYTAILTIDGQAVANSNGLPPNLGTNIKVKTDLCTTMYIDFYDNYGNPAHLIPYLAASAHFTISNRDNAVYHAHGMFRPTNLDMTDVVTSLNGMSMPQLHELDPMTNPLYNISMNALMVGVQTNGTINCLSDAGAVQQQMQGMMNMSLFYGPSNFSSIMGIFNFPDVGHFTIFVYVKVLTPDGVERLIVPNWAINAYQIDTSTTDNCVNCDDDSSSNIGRSSFEFLSFTVMLLFISALF